MINFENLNKKGIEQGYGTKLYFRLVLKILNVIKGSTFVYTFLCYECQWYGVHSYECLSMT